MSFRRAKVLWILAVSLCSTAASASDCETYIGKSITPVSIATLGSTFAGVPNKKDEYETTAQFEVRLAALQLDHTYVVSTDFSPNSMKYDADKNVLSVSYYSIADAIGRCGRTSYDGNGPGILNVDFVLRETSALDGSYSASNAYGASRIVNKTKNTQITLWQQRAYGAHNAFPENELGSVADLQVGPEQARLLKKSLKFAVSFRPKPPYREIFWDFQRPEIDDPRDITTINTVIHADIHCGLFYDLTGKVFGTIVGR